MRFVDVNVLVYALRQDSPRSDEFAAWLDAARSDAEPLGIPSVVVSGVVRIVTSPRIFAEPSTSTEAWDFVDALLAGPSTRLVDPGTRHLGIFRGMCEKVGARGNLVADAYLAAMALESGATMFSTDRDFAKFPDLRWRHPLEG